MTTAKVVESTFANNLNISTSTVKKTNDGVFDNLLKKVETKSKETGKNEETVSKDTKAASDNTKTQDAVKTEKNNNVNKKNKQVKEVKKDNQQDMTAKDNEIEEDSYDFESLDEYIDSIESNVKESVNDLREKIKGILDIDDEELDKALEEMGISVVGLFVQDFAKELVVNVSGEEDFSAILTNESLCDQISSVMELVEKSDISESLNVESAELEGIIKEAMDNLRQLKENDTVNEEVKAPDLIKEDDNNVNIATESEIEKTTVLTNNIKENEIEKTAVDSNSKEINNVEEKHNKKISKDDVKDINNNVNEKKSDNDKQQYSGSDGNNNMNDSDDADKVMVSKTAASTADTRGTKTETSDKNFEIFLDNLTNSVQDMDNMLVQEVVKVKEIRKIATQIIDKIRVNVNQDTTSMEVVLNPHNLGKVNLSIVSKNGDVSAKFIVENEMVKEALEINMESLKERFDKQGITVNAIEVVVAEGDMFNEGGAGTGQNRQQERRRSNYVDDETITVNTQEIREEILAEMMQENGNQVNYSA